MGFAQVGAMVQLKNMGLFKTQGLINGEWANALDNRTLAVCTHAVTYSYFPSRLCSRVV